MKTMLITGAAGFIGRAACARYKDQYSVIAVDDMSRPTARVPEGVPFIRGHAFNRAGEFDSGIDVVIHLAAQVSALESMSHPSNDFSRNASLTFNLAQWAAHFNPKPIFIYANTNKVFGEMPGVRCPILDSQPLDPCTPYGISKATGGMYVREFLPDTGYDFRQSCIFSQHQIGAFDQGWVGYVSRQAMKGESITCCGDGTQVRDLLHVNDLLSAYDLAIDGTLEPGSYGVGGGPENAHSFADVVRMLGANISVFWDKRPRDQNYCVMAADGLRAVGWKPLYNAEAVIKLHMGVSGAAK